MNTSIKFLILIISITFATHLFAQTTGKVAGTVFDADTDEPLAGANVIIDGTYLGASVDVDGYFYILNIPPGTYTVSILMVGYNDYKVENLRVSVNRTTNIEAELKQALIEGDVIIVQADKADTKKDQTSSMRTVSSAQMEVLPIDGLQGVIDMQAGVVKGAFRGGRNTEVTYMVDGMQVDESFKKDGKAVDLEKESIEDLEIITGTFNAEYGRAMSGVVNAVTKNGGDEFEASLTAYGGMYITGYGAPTYNTIKKDEIFIGLDEVDPLRNREISGSFSGPIIPNKMHFIVNGRFQDRKNHLNGYRMFNPDDFTFYNSAFGEWRTIHSQLSVANGDKKFVPMNDALNVSLMGKLSYNFSTSLKSSFLYTRNDDEWNDYNHVYKYNPDGVPTAHRETDMYSFRISHTLSSSAFYEINLSLVDNKGGYYLYDDPTSSKYVHDAYRQGNDETGVGFLTGGQIKTNEHRHSKNGNIKADLTWQVNKTHNIKGGFLITQHRIQYNSGTIENWIQDFTTANADSFSFAPAGNSFKIEFPNYRPYLPGNENINTDHYKVWPYEIGAYIQDKLEHEDLVVNFGLRLDYFNPNTQYPTNRRNPSNNPQFAEPTEYVDADEKIQISPRFGLAYQLGDRAVLRFSYGHFFQMPPMYALYQHNSFNVSPDDYATTMGNSQLKAQKTVQYEIGLWQQLNENMGIEVALYYRDIYDLLSTKVVATENQVEYGLFTNKDYGNTKGLELKLDYTMGNLRANLNYTLQYTRGNADNPAQNYNRAGNVTDPVTRLIVMTWDQRHTLNATVGYHMPVWGTTVTGYYNSGSPYTYAPDFYSPLLDVNLPPNNDTRPQTFSVDLNSYYKWEFDAGFSLQLYLNVFNLLDGLNDVEVNSRTGKAYTNIPQVGETLTHQTDFNDYYDRVRNPSQYATPRYVKIGLGINY